MKTRFHMLMISLLLLSAFAATPAQAIVPIINPANGTLILETFVPITGEIEAITIADPGDPWSAATIQVRGQRVIIPRNLLIDLPNEVLTMQQILKKAPPACQVTGETGIAKNDRCNPLGTGAFTDIKANRSAGGNIIAGMVNISKGNEIVQGTVSFIDFNNGYFRVNGNIIAPGGLDDGSGTMVRVNDPTATHTIQKGPGCIPGNTVNCSADTRFDIDPANYTFNFASAFPACIPSTVARPGITPATPAGLNDSGCPHTPANPATDNRPDVTTPATYTISFTALQAAGGPGAVVPVAGDSRHFAPIWVGDTVTATGAFEVISGVQFLSAWAVQVQVELRNDRARADQPEYFFIELNQGTAGVEVEGHVFAPRITVTASDNLEVMDVFTVHFDPVFNSHHERLHYTTECNKRQGPDLFVIPTGESNMFIRMDFRIGKPPIGFEPCLALFGQDTASECVPFQGATPAKVPVPAAPAIPALAAQAALLCPAAALFPPPVFPRPAFPAAADCGVKGGGVFSPFCIDDYNIMYPNYRQVVVRGRRTETGAITGTATDIQGRPAQSGFYFLPTAFEDFDTYAMTLGMNASPANFDTIPWLLDRRLSTNGCVGPCETQPQPLTPFPFANIDPRDTAIIASIITGFTAFPTPNQFFATVPPGIAAGAPVTTMSGSLLVGGADPAVNPAASTLPAITATPAFDLFAPVANDDNANARINPVLPVKIKVLANDIPLAGTLDVSTVRLVSTPASGTAQVNPDGTITYTPNATATAGTDTFTYTVANSAGAVSNTANVTVTLIGAKTHTITALSDSKGTISPSSTMTVNDGGSQTFTFTPNTGYQIVDVVVDGKSVGVPVSGSFTFPPIKEDGHTISVRSIPDGTTKADGKVDVSDALRAMKIVTGLIAPNANDLLHYRVAPLGPDGVPAPDCSPSIPQPCRSGGIGINDALLILRKAAGFTTGF